MGKPRLQISGRRKPYVRITREQSVHWSVRSKQRFDFTHLALPCDEGMPKITVIGDRHLVFEVIVVDNGKATRMRAIVKLSHDSKKVWRTLVSSTSSVPLHYASVAAWRNTTELVAV